MPLITTTPKSHIEAKYDAITKLEEKCEHFKCFGDKEAVSIFIYSVGKDYTTEDGPAMIAVADFGNNKYAVHTPDYLTDKQLVVFDFLLRHVDERDSFAVFSEKSYNAVKKYSHDKPVNVELHV